MRSFLDNKNLSLWFSGLKTESGSERLSGWQTPLRRASLSLRENKWGTENGGI
jgi:hypothetical protein